MTDYRDLLDVWTEAAEKLGYDLTLRRGEKLGWKSVRPDFTTHEGFRWPFPGGNVVSEGTEGGACPAFPGDGYCLAKTAVGAQSGGIPLHSVILVAWRGLLGEDDAKRRVKSARVLALVDARRTDLSGADLRGAYLSEAYLSGADLRGADLRGADLSGADLRGADLSGADLRGADLSGAYLREADLRGADLSGAYLRGTNLYGAYANKLTLWPTGFDPISAGVNVA